MTEKHGIERMKTPTAMTKSSSHGLGDLPPLEQVLARVQIRWPFPRMEELEYQDWVETLAGCPIPKILAALDRLMKQPPVHNGEEYRGRPGLVDVTRTMDILREEEQARIKLVTEENRRLEQRELEERRRQHPEEFFGWHDVLKAAAEMVPKSQEPLKAMPVEPVSPVLFTDAARNARLSQLEAQKAAILREYLAPLEND